MRRSLLILIALLLAGVAIAGGSYVLARHICTHQLAGSGDAGSAADSVLPSLAYGPYCSSTVSLQNLADTAVDVELVAHRSSGALVPLTGHARKVVHLSAGERASRSLRR